MKRSIDADLQVTLDDGSVMVYSSILTVASNVFKTMLTSGLTEETNWTIALPGKTMASFMRVYNMLHTETAVPFTVDTVFDVIAIAHEYEMSHLYQTAIKFVTLSVETCCAEAYVLAKRLDLNDLLHKIEHSLANNPRVGDFFLNDNVFASLDDCLADKVGTCLRNGVARVVPFVPLVYQSHLNKQRTEFADFMIPSCKYLCKAILLQAINGLCLNRWNSNYGYVDYEINNRLAIQYHEKMQAISNQTRCWNEQ